MNSIHPFTLVHEIALLERRIKDFYEKHGNTVTAENRRLIGTCSTSRNGWVVWNAQLLPLWEFLLLKELALISDKGVLKNYPVLRLDEGDGLCSRVDCGGDLDEIYARINASRTARAKVRASLELVPLYGRYLRMKREIENERRKEGIFAALGARQRLTA